MPKNDYICPTSSRQCEICTFLKWIYTETLSVKNRIRYGISYRLRKKRARHPQGWLILFLNLYPKLTISYIVLDGLHYCV